MKKLLITALIAISAIPAFAQNFITRTGKISFNATSPGSVENIEAVNNEVACILDGKTGNVVFQAPIRSFKFQRDKMQEHFNEEYMESDKYPKADFKGSITNLADVNFSKDGTYAAKVAGKLTMHGVTKDVNVPGTVVVKGGSVALQAKFSVKLADYNIKIPSLVADKVGKEAAITIESNLAKK